MANAHEASAGVHGYSAPGAELVVFEVSKGMLWALDQQGKAKGISKVVGVMPRQVLGCWNGEESPAYILPLPAFRELQRRLPALLAHEDCVLILGQAEARGWRPARLEWLRGDRLGEVEPVGTWHEVTEREARQCDGSTHDIETGAWFIVSDNPAPSLSARDVATLPIDPAPRAPMSTRPEPHDYSAEPGGVALHLNLADQDARRADTCEARGDLSDALYFQRRAGVHMAYAMRGLERSEVYWHAEARDATERLHAANARRRFDDQGEVSEALRRATLWELIAKAQSCTIGRREMVRPRLEHEAVTWAEAEQALAWITARRFEGWKS